MPSGGVLAKHNFFKSPYCFPYYLPLLNRRCHMKPVLLLLLLITTTLAAQTKAEDVKSFTLKNGMKFLVLEDHSIPNANMYLFFKVGSRNEHPALPACRTFSST
jgi:hypothetical protein